MVEGVGKQIGVSTVGSYLKLIIQWFIARSEELVVVNTLNIIWVGPGDEARVLVHTILIGTTSRQRSLCFLLKLLLLMVANDPM